MKQTKAWLLSIVLCLAVIFGMALKTVASDEVVIPEEGYIYDEALNTYFMYTAKSWQSVVYETRTTGVEGNPATIKLMADLTVTDGTPENDSQNAVRSSMRLLSGEVILDLNGCSLTLEKDTQNSYMRNRILIEENASLTISDSSDEKQGKISINDENMIASSGNLTINAGTFEVHEIEISNRSYSILYAYEGAYTVINGGTFKSEDCITPQNSTLIINGGTFIGERNAVYLYGTGDHRIYGGSFTGGTADIFTAKKTGFLFVDPTTGIGATFPGGLEVKKSAIAAGVVGECLADNMKFFVGDTQITSGLDAPSIAGDVVVKCLHGEYTDGICNYCNFKCPHKTMNNNTCTDCGFVCSHKTYENGFCTECSKYAAATLNSKGYYEIKNAGNLFWFADQVNSGGEAGRYLNAVLLNDINLEKREWKPIGTTGGTTSQSFRGIFDGNGKTITGLYVESKRKGVGLFGEVRQGTVKNFTIYGEVKLIGEYNYIGGVIGSACGTANENGSTISGITSYVNVTLGEGSHGSNHVGGMIGYVNHSTVVENCVWYGTLDLNEYRAQDGVGGLIGKANRQFRGTIRNCAAYGTIETEYKNGSFSDNDGTPFDSIFIGGIISNCLKDSVTTIDGCIWAGTFVDKTDLGEKANLAAYGTFNGTITVNNCYYLEGSAPYVTTNEYQSGGIVKVTQAQLTSGEIAYKLGSAWGQEIGKDTYPVPGGAKVYYFDNNYGEFYTNTATVTATATFDQNGGTGGSPASATFTYGNAYSLTDPVAPTRKGYIFDGYVATVKSGGETLTVKIFNADMTAAHTVWPIASDVTLTAKWTSIADAFEGAVLSTDVVGGEIVIVIPVNVGEAMTEDELRNNFKDKTVNITSNNGIIGTGCKVTIGGYEIELVVKGDIDGDGVATVFDALMVKKALANNGFENETLREYAADVDGTEGTVASDVKALLGFIVGK